MNAQRNQELAELLMELTTPHCGQDIIRGDRCTVSALDQWLDVAIGLTLDNAVDDAALRVHGLAHFLGDCGERILRRASAEQFRAEA